MPQKKTPAKKSSLITQPSGTLSTAHLRAFKSKSAIRLPSHRQTPIGK